MTDDSGVIRPRPFARLLNLLGEQLIKDSAVALTELAKNSYDADANWVQIRVGNMANFGKEKLSPADEPFLEIEDDGDGMTLDILRNHWMNPATPIKAARRRENKGRTKKGRPIQGEKGVGRFAVFQIGGNVEIFTRPEGAPKKQEKEIHLVTDFGNIEFSDLETSQKKGSVVYFDEIEALYDTYLPAKKIVERELSIRGDLVRAEDHGTLIRITGLRYVWTEAEVKKVLAALMRLQSPFQKSDFTVSIVFEGQELSYDGAEKIHEVLGEAAIQCTASIDKDGVATLKINKKQKVIDLVDQTREDFVAENKLRFFDVAGI